MKTDSPAPDHEGLKALLAKSFHAEEAENVPTLPEALRARIRGQYGQTKAQGQAETAALSESLFAKIARLFAQPQFSGAAAAIVLIAVAAFLLVPTKDDLTNSSDFRGIETPATTTATIILYGFDSENASSIKELLDPKAARILEDIAGEPSAEGATIIIDGKDREIQGYTSRDAEPIIIPLPESEAKIADAIAKMLETLKGK
jgi:hypothetical protein